MPLTIEIYCMFVVCTVRECITRNMFAHAVYHHPPLVDAAQLQEQQSLV